MYLTSKMSKVKWIKNGFEYGSNSVNQRNSSDGFSILNNSIDLSEIQMIGGLCRLDICSKTTSIQLSKDFDPEYEVIQTMLFNLENIIWTMFVERVEWWNKKSKTLMPPDNACVCMQCWWLDLDNDRDCKLGLDVVLEFKISGFWFLHSVCSKWNKWKIERFFSKF